MRVHTREQLEAVRSGTFDDADTPFFPDIFEIAKLSAGAAMLAAEHALAGRPAFSLMRPPGHHAERNRVMGFCYFNNIAIAVAKVLQSSPRVQRVAILDFDCHHGNGTEDIFRGDERVLFVSLHQSPCYPGTGIMSGANCINYPLAPGTGPEKFLETLDEAMERIRGFDPQLLAVSAGFDSFKNDPITHMGLEVETFYEIGRRVADLTQPTAAAPALTVFCRARRWLRPRIRPVRGRIRRRTGTTLNASNENHCDNDWVCDCIAVVHGAIHHHKLGW